MTHESSSAESLELIRLRERVAELERLLARAMSLHEGTRYKAPQLLADADQRRKEEGC
jgi:hypothetical protein